MKRKILSSGIHASALFTLLLFLLGFDLSFAQGIVPNCQGDECNFSHFVQLAQNILDFLIKIVVVGSVIVFAWAGFKYMTAGGNSSKIHEAHSIFKHVALGLILALVAWLIISTLLAVLTGKDLKDTLDETKINLITDKTSSA